MSPAVCAVGRGSQWGGASLSGSASSRIMRVWDESGVGAGGGGERGGRFGGDRRRPAIRRAGGVCGGEELVGSGSCRLGAGGAWNLSRDSLPPGIDRMCRSPCHSGSHCTRQSCKGTGCAGEAGRQEGQVQTGTASMCVEGGELGRQCACHQAEQRSHWKRGGPECWWPAPSPHWWHGAWTK